MCQYETNGLKRYFLSHQQPQPSDHYHHVKPFTVYFFILFFHLSSLASASLHRKQIHPTFPTQPTCPCQRLSLACNIYCGIDIDSRRRYGTLILVVGFDGSGSIGGIIWNRRNTAEIISSRRVEGEGGWCKICPEYILHCLGVDRTHPIVGDIQGPQGI